MMRSCNNFVWKIMSAGAALALLLPQLALGEFGVCPPYSKTFSEPDTLAEEAEIRAFLGEINARPGGGTLILEPGSYWLEDTIAITGIVCIRATRDAETHPNVVLPFDIASGGMLTLRFVELDAWRCCTGGESAVTVLAGGWLFAEDTNLTLQADRHPASLANDGTVFFHDVTINGYGVNGIANTGTLSMTRGGIEEFFGDVEGGGAALDNAGRAFLDGVSIADNHGGSYCDYSVEYCDDPSSSTFLGIRNSPGGALTVENSVVADNYGCDRQPGACPPDEPCIDTTPLRCIGVGLQNLAGGVAELYNTTVAFNHVPLEFRASCDAGDTECLGTGIDNQGGDVSLRGTIVADHLTNDCVGTVADGNYNVIGDLTGCNVLNPQPDSIEADPLFIDGSVELASGSPAIDLIPLELSTPEDGLGRARTDGNNDGIVAADAGAREYGYVSVEVTVRTTPYWRSIGKVDLTRTNALFVAVMSGGPIDPTSILFDSIAVGDFPSSAMRGVGYGDKNGDGLPDYNFWYRLDRALVLECRDYDEPFSALTDDGQQVTGRLRFEVVGCTP